jgi:hypothetical protein
MTDKAALTAKLEQAKTDIATAESALDSAIKGLKSGLRAEKEILDTTLESAFLRLRAAHAALAELQALIEAD